MVLALYKILDDKKVNKKNLSSELSKTKELISELLPLIHALDKNNIDRLAEIKKITK
jgi:hypothetical protein